MDKVYYLDLQTLLDYLQRQSALLSTAASVPGARGKGKGYVFLKEGTIIGCLIYDVDGNLVGEGESAYALISNSEQWQVRIDPDIECSLKALKKPQSQGGDIYSTPPIQERSTYSTPPPSYILPYIPRQICPLDARLLTAFNLKQRLILRMVYAMANGERTVEQIKAQLHIPPQTVDEALSSLRYIGVVA